MLDTEIRSGIYTSVNMNDRLHRLMDYLVESF